MTDKETLILAAKAAGYKIKWFDRGGVEKAWRHIEGDYWEAWNPYTSNDDCFRLETALELELIWEVDLVRIGTVIEWFEDHNGDKDKARRYASTRAAALRGRE